MTEAVAGLAGLRLRSVTCTPVEVPLRYVLGTSAATVRAAPLLLVEVLTEEGVVGRSYVFCYRRSGARSIALVLEEAAEAGARRQRRAAGDRGQAGAPLRPARRDGRRAHGLVGFRHGVVGRAGRRRRRAADPPARRHAAPAARLQLLRARPDEPAGGGRRSRGAARRRHAGGEAAPGLRDAGRGPGGDPRRARAPAGRGGAAGRLQPGAVARRGAGPRAARCSPKAWPGWKSRSATTTCAGNAEIARALDLPLQLGRELRRPQGPAAGACRQAPATS